MEQEAWIRKERESECQVLKEACEMLAQSGFGMSHVTVVLVMMTVLPEAFSKRREVDITTPSLWDGRGYLG